MEEIKLCRIGEAANGQPADEFCLGFRELKKNFLISCHHLNIRRLHVCLFDFLSQLLTSLRETRDLAAIGWN